MAEGLCPEIFARKDRRIDQRFIVDQSKVHALARSRSRTKCRCRPPAAWQGQACCNWDLPGCPASRVEGDRLPLQVDDFGRNDNPPLILLGRREKLEGEIKLPRSRRHIDLKGINIQRIALPWQQLAAGPDCQASQLLDLATRCMIAREPFRKIERHRTRRRERNCLGHAKNALLCVGRINIERHRAGKRCVPGLAQRRGGHGSRKQQAGKIKTHQAPPRILRQLSGKPIKCKSASRPMAKIAHTNDSA